MGLSSARSQWSGSFSKSSTNFAKSSITSSWLNGWRGYHHSLAQRWLFGVSMSSLFCQAENSRSLRYRYRMVKMNHPLSGWILLTLLQGQSVELRGDLPQVAVVHRLGVTDERLPSLLGTYLRPSSPARSAIIHLRLVQAFLFSDSNMTLASGAR